MQESYCFLEGMGYSLTCLRSPDPTFLKFILIYMVFKTLSGLVARFNIKRFDLKIQISGCLEKCKGPPLLNTLSFQSNKCVTQAFFR
jgi:hypothetical protein